MRLTAYKLKIEDLIEGRYVRPGVGEPDYLLTPWGQRISRARVLGTVVEKFVREDQGYCSLCIDDGSGTITLRAWRERVPELSSFSLGDLVDAIGRAREYGGEIYLVPEIIMRVEDPNWELLRELEILQARRRALAQGARPQLKRLQRPEAEGGAGAELIGAAKGIEEAPPLPEVPRELEERALLAFDKLDRGAGVMAADLAAELNLSQSRVEDVLRFLIAKGEIFEPTLGRFRRLG